MKHPAWLWALCIAGGCESGEPLREDILSHAQARWQDAAIRDYDWMLRIDGDRVDSGSFLVRVREGEPVSITRGETPVSSRDAFYTVRGFFTFLLDEMDMATNPGRYWQVPAGTSVHQTVAFDDALGFPTRYLRSVRGSKHGILIRGSDLSARSAPTAGVPRGRK